jgi:hypothetical protein
MPHMRLSNPKGKKSQNRTGPLDDIGVEMDVHLRGFN